MNAKISAYFSIRGRIGREDFLIKYFLPTFFIATVFSLIWGYAASTSCSDTTSPETCYLFGFSFVFKLLVFGLLAIICVIGQIKRFHDMNLSGLFALFNLLPLAAPLIIFVLSIMPGSAGENKYGKNPRLEKHRGKIKSGN